SSLGRSESHSRICTSFPSATTARAPARRNSTANGSPPGCTRTNSGRSGACWRISSTRAVTDLLRGTRVDATTTSAALGSSTKRLVPASSKRRTAAWWSPTPNTPGSDASGCCSSSTGSSSTAVVIDSPKSLYPVGRGSDPSSGLVFGLLRRFVDVHRLGFERGHEASHGLVPEPAEKDHGGQHDQRPHPSLEQGDALFEQQHGDGNEADEAPHGGKPLDGAGSPHRRPTSSRMASATSTGVAR